MELHFSEVPFLHVSRLAWATRNICMEMKRWRQNRAIAFLRLTLGAKVLLYLAHIVTELLAYLVGKGSSWLLASYLSQNPVQLLQVLSQKHEKLQVNGANSFCWPPRSQGWWPRESHVIPLCSYQFQFILTLTSFTPKFLSLLRNTTNWQRHQAQQETQVNSLHRII